MSSKTALNENALINGECLSKSEKLMQVVMHTHVGFWLLASLSTLSKLLNLGHYSSNGEFEKPDCIKVECTIQSFLNKNTTNITPMTIALYLPSYCMKYSSFMARRLNFKAYNVLARYYDPTIRTNRT